MSALVLRFSHLLWSVWQETRDRTTSYTTTIKTKNQSPVWIVQPRFTHPRLHVTFLAVLPTISAQTPFSRSAVSWRLVKFESKFTAPASNIG